MGLKFENVKTFNWMNAIRGMRNPLSSHDKMDSRYEIDEKEGTKFILGDNDYKLAYKLSKAGTDHGKYLRQIFVSFHLEGPWLFWKQYSTYKVATVENSTSMMHTLSNEKLTADNFCWTKISPFRKRFLNHINGLIDNIQELNKKINKTKGKNIIWETKKQQLELEEKRNNIWRELNEDMSGSYLYKRTCSSNYQVIKNQFHSRKKHKLSEWNEDFVKFVRSLPYSSLITLEK